MLFQLLIKSVNLGFNFGFSICKAKISNFQRFRIRYLISFQRDSYLNAFLEKRAYWQAKFDNEVILKYVSFSFWRTEGIKEQRRLKI